MFSKYLNCDYLPSFNGDGSCFYRHVQCHDIPKVKFASLFINRTEDKETVLQYSCNEGFTLVGNNTMTCINGSWSKTPPQCKPNTSPIMAIITIIFTILTIVVTITLVICKIRLKAKRTVVLKRLEDCVDDELNEIDDPLKHFRRVEGKDNVSPLKRNRDFDAFVLYHFDSNDSFVVNYLLPELEETRNFNLYIHSRNFTPGLDIKDNIEEAIEGSNSAIIIMSQGFVDSMWCKEEFTHCYIENMKDAAFNLFVIMMQPADTLVNISPYMKTFIANRTYLQVNEPELFAKLARHLEDARL